MSLNHCLAYKWFGAKNYSLVDKIVRLELLSLLMPSSNPKPSELFCSILNVHFSASCEILLLSSSLAPRRPLIKISVSQAGRSLDLCALLGEEQPRKESFPLGLDCDMSRK